MNARGIHAGMVRMVFNQHHIADVATTCDRAFEQVVAQDAAVWKPLVEHSVYGLYIEQSLAGEGAQAKHVLIEV